MSSPDLKWLRSYGFLPGYRYPFWSPEWSGLSHRPPLGSVGCSPFLQSSAPRLALVDLFPVDCIQRTGTPKLSARRNTRSIPLRTSGFLLWISHAPVQVSSDPPQNIWRDRLPSHFGAPASFDSRHIANGILGRCAVGSGNPIDRWMLLMAAILIFTVPGAFCSFTEQWTMYSRNRFSSLRSYPVTYLTGSTPLRLQNSCHHLYCDLYTFMVDFEYLSSRRAHPS